MLVQNQVVWKILFNFKTLLREMIQFHSYFWTFLKWVEITNKLNNFWFKFGGVGDIVKKSGGSQLPAINGIHHPLRVPTWSHGAYRVPAPSTHRASASSKCKTVDRESEWQKNKSRWWFQISFIFTPDPWGNDPFWRACFSRGSTTNQWPIVFYFHPGSLGKMNPFWRMFFKWVGWNHQLEVVRFIKLSNIHCHP